VKATSRARAVKLLEFVRDPVQALGRCGVIYMSSTPGWQSRWPDAFSDPDLYSCNWQNNEPDEHDGFQSDESASLDESVQ
jgi:hypothetical protein